MERQEFETYMQKYADQIEQIRQSAHDLHQSVNQTYGDDLPYGYHLDMVVQAATSVRCDTLTSQMTRIHGVSLRDV